MALVVIINYLEFMGIGENIVRREKVSSTNSVAAVLLETMKIADGTVIFAIEQFRGKGQGSNTWESEPGKNLNISIILFPKFLPPEKQFYLSKVISLAIIDFLEQYCIKLSIKWPNDIYVAGDKIAGILIENSLTGSSIDHTIAGIGININQETFKSKPPNATSLKLVTGNDYNIEQLFRELCHECEKWYSALRNGKSEKIDKYYLERLSWFNEKRSFISSKGPFNGVIRGVNEHGRLQIENARGEILSFGFGEINFIS